MNQEILNTEVQHFISENLNSNLDKILFKKQIFKTISNQEIVHQIIAKNKCKLKLPTWFSTKKIIYPDKVNIEQTSSEVTAQYKASLVSGETLVDITGGFGVDTFYFSKKVNQVIHCELDENLAKITKHNFKQLDVTNISSFTGNGLDYLHQNNHAVDWIYVDPSRRDTKKNKVFIIEDCTPNIIEHLNFLCTKSENILVKLSPILDLKACVNALKFVKTIHIVAIKNEVKELLFHLKSHYSGPTHIETVNIKNKEFTTFKSTYPSSVKANYSLPQTYLYEPNAAILKAGLFNEVSHQFKLNKLNINSHLYTSNNLIKFPGRRFRIKDSLKFSRKNIKSALPKNQANITTRNFPESVASIRKKTKLKEGGTDYLFFTTDINDKHLVLWCEKV